MVFRQVELGTEADTVVNGAIRARGRQVFQELAADDVVHFEARDAGGLTAVLDQMIFSDAALADKDEVLVALVTPDQSFQSVEEKK